MRISYKPEYGKYDSLFRLYGKKYNVDPLLLKAQVWQESRFNPNAESRAGAKGLAQFMPATWAEIAGKEKSATNPKDSVEAQAKYMKLLFSIFADEPEEYRTEIVLAAYNWGMGNVQRSLKETGFHMLKNLLPEETAGYIRRINQYYNWLKANKPL